jgi:hypothetical protein
LPENPSRQEPMAARPSTSREISKSKPTGNISEEAIEEQRLLRRLNMMMNMVMSVIAQDATLSLDQASQMVADARTAALAMFPGKELAWSLIYQPRLQRLMRERYRIM